MKKLLTMSMVAAIAVAGNAFAAERDTRMSDIVRLLEDNPHLMAETEADIAARAALKTTAIKNVSLKKVTTPISKVSTLSGNSKMVQQGYYDEDGHYIPEKITEVFLLMDAPKMLCNDTTIAEATKLMKETYGENSKEMGWLEDTIADCN